MLTATVIHNRIGHNIVEAIWPRLPSETPDTIRPIRLAELDVAVTLDEVYAWVGPD